MKKLVRNNLLFTSLVIFLISGSCAAQNADIDLLKQINQHETSFKNNFTKTTAASVTYKTIATPLAMLTAGLVKKDDNCNLRPPTSPEATLLRPQLHTA